MGRWGKGHMSTNEPEYLLSGLTSHWPPWYEISLMWKWIWKEWIVEAFWSSVPLRNPPTPATKRFSYRGKLGRFGVLVRDGTVFTLYLYFSQWLSKAGFLSRMLCLFTPHYQASSKVDITKQLQFFFLQSLDSLPPGSFSKQSSGRQPTLIVEGWHTR